MSSKYFSIEVRTFGPKQVQTNTLTVSPRHTKHHHPAKPSSYQCLMIMTLVLCVVSVDDLALSLYPPVERSAVEMNVSLYHTHTGRVQTSPSLSGPVPA